MATIESSVAQGAGRILETPFSGLGIQRRQAFRLRMRLPVHVEAPMHMYCQTVDLSVLGLRLDRELPCAPGVEIGFTVELPTFDGIRPLEVELQAEVVRVQAGDTGLRFVNLTTDQERVVRQIVNEHQRRLLAARQAARQGLFQIVGGRCRLV